MAPSHLMVAFDFSDSAYRALDYAIEFADRVGAKLSVIHVVQIAFDVEKGLAAKLAEPTREWSQSAVNEGRALLRKVRDSKFGDRASEVELHVLYGRPEEEIVAAAEKEKAQLIVTGTTGRTGLKHTLLGSVAERVVRTSRIPVLVVP